MVRCAYKNCMDDKRRKLCSHQRAQIKKLFKNNHDIKTLAKKFNVSRTSIQKIVSPSYEEKQKQYSNMFNQMKYWTDDHFKEKVKEASKKIMKERYDTDEDYKKCHLLQMRQYRQNNE